MTDKNFFESYGIVFNGEKEIKYDASQMLMLFIRAKSENKKLTLPENSDEKEIEKLKSFLETYKEAFTSTKRGLKHDWHCGYSLITEDEKTLYIFSFVGSGTPMLINGVVNKDKNIYILPENKPLKSDSSLGLGAGPGTIWLSLNKEDIHDVCTVIKIVFKEKIKLYEGTGAPITVN